MKWKGWRSILMDMQTTCPSQRHFGKSVIVQPIKASSISCLTNMCYKWQEREKWIMCFAELPSKAVCPTCPLPLCLVGAFRASGSQRWVKLINNWRVNLLEPLWFCISYWLCIFNELEGGSAKQHPFHLQHNTKSSKRRNSIYFTKTSKPNSKLAGKTVVASHGILKK